MSVLLIAGAPLPADYWPVDLQCPLCGSALEDVSAITTIDERPLRRPLETWLICRPCSVQCYERGATASYPHVTRQVFIGNYRATCTREDVRRARGWEPFQVDIGPDGLVRPKSDVTTGP